MAPRPPPTTFEIIEALALTEPGRLAVREDDAELTYAQLHATVLHCARELQSVGVRHGARVAVSGPGFALQLVLLLACEALGAVTASFQGQGDPDADFLFTLVDWVFSPLAQAVPAGVRLERIDAERVRAWTQPLASGMDVVREPAALAQPQRIARTSGSSGRSKFMVLTRQAQEQWLVRGGELGGYGRGTRLLLLGPLVINAAYTRASGCLRRGGAVLAGDGGRIEALAPTHLWGLPLQVERLLAELPAGWRAPAPVSVATVGGAVPPRLQAAIAAVFGGRLSNRYGSNEAGAICDDMDAEGRGLLSPGVDVRILDEGGAELPPGQPGRIAVRTPALAEGYLGLPEETAAAFRDGWFVSGDVGLLVGRRMLQLLGRADDLVNLGGIKLPAAQIESQVQVLPAVADCVALAVHLEGGAVSIGLAVVVAAGSSEAEATRQLRERLQLPAGAAVRVLFLRELPRLAAGKVDRMALQRRFAAG